MPKTYPVRNAFNAGEISELVEFRDDVQKYSSACLTLENAVPLVEGGAKKMPGTYFAGASALGGAMFTGSIDGETLTVTEVFYGFLREGQTLIGEGVAEGTIITAVDIVFADLQALGSPGWTLTGGTATSGGTNTGSPAATYFNPTPSRTVGGSIALTSNGNGYNSQIYTLLPSSRLPGSNPLLITDATVDAYLWIPSTVDSPQALEGPNIPMYNGTHIMYPSIQADSASGLWRLWNGAAGAWVATAYSCVAFLAAKDQWQHIQVHYQFHSATNQYTYQDLTVNGVSVFANLGTTYTGGVDAGAVSIKTQVQVDNTAGATATTIYYDSITTTLWTEDGAGSGGVGIYTVNNSQTVGSELMQIASTGKSRLAPFQFSKAQGAVLELSEHIIRIWEGATAGDWSLGLALQAPNAIDYNPATAYIAGGFALVGPYVPALFYTHIAHPPSWVPNPALGTLSFAAPYGSSFSNLVPITFTTNTVDVLDVTVTGSTPNQGINIALSNATAAHNAAALIQGAIRALISLNASGNNLVDLSAWTVTPDPIYFATPWITDPTVPASPQFYLGFSPSFIVECVLGNVNDQFPLLGEGFNSTYWEQYVPPPVTPPIELVTPYLEGDLFELDCSTQSADVLWIFHPSYPPAVVERLGANSWAYSPSLPGQQPGEPPYRGTLGVVTTGYSALGQSITDITKANPCVLSVAATSYVFSDGDRIYANLIAGMVELNQGEFIVRNPSLTGSGTLSVELEDPNTGNPVDSTGYHTYVDGGFAVKVVALFASPGDYPACGTLYQQRLIVGGSNNNPTQFSGSVEEDYPDFIIDPNADDFAIQFRLVSKQLNQLLNMIGTPNALLIGTSGGVWVVSGSSSTAISQTNIDASLNTSQGVAPLEPQLVNGSAIFVSRSTRIVTFLVFNFGSNQWESNDLTRLNRSITLGTSESTSGVAQTAFQMEPYPIFWAVRNDGQLIALVFNTQDQVYAWFRVNMVPEGGSIESVAVISGSGQEDQMVVMVKRTINGIVQRYVEYFMPQEIFSDLSNAFLVHCGQQLRGVGPSAITAITQATPAVVTQADHGFSTSMTIGIAEVVGVLDAQGTSIVNTDPTEAWTITVIDANTYSLDTSDTTAATAYVSGGVAQQVFNQVTGMNYLLSQTVVAVGDGAIILPLDPPTIVSSDTVTFATYANLITIGIPYDYILQPTNPVLSQQGATTRGMPQKMNRVTLSLYQAMGGEYGQDLDHMYPLVYGAGTQLQPPAMFTGAPTVDTDYDWSEESTFYVRHSDPLPFTLRGIVFRMSANQD